MAKVVVRSTRELCRHERIESVVVRPGVGGDDWDHVTGRCLCGSTTYPMTVSVSRGDMRPQAVGNGVVRLLGKSFDELGGRVDG